MYTGAWYKNLTWKTDLGKVKEEMLIISTCSVNLSSWKSYQQNLIGMEQLLLIPVGDRRGRKRVRTLYGMQALAFHIQSGTHGSSLMQNSEERGAFGSVGTTSDLFSTYSTPIFPQGVDVLSSKLLCRETQT